MDTSDHAGEPAARRQCVCDSDVRRCVTPYALVWNEFVRAEAPAGLVEEASVCGFAYKGAFLRCGRVRR